MVLGAFGLAVQSVGSTASSVTAGIHLSKLLSWPPKKVKKMFAPDIRGFETLEKPLNTVLNLLKPEKKSRVIQIYGALGVGKTTIMQNLNNHEEVANLFQMVIWLDVSSDNPATFGKKKNLGLEELQMKVMQRLNLNTASPVSQYSEKIEEKLKDTKYLLLLDNVKESVNTDEIGFPNNWEQTGSKIVLTTRYKGVCPVIVDYRIEVGLLTPLESQRMFCNILEPKDSESWKLMGRALNRCGHLPFAINIVAGYCKSKDNVESLRTGVDSLSRFPTYGDSEIKEMCEQLSFCYEGLEDVKLDCFCYSALYPEESDIYIDRLLDCWMAENLLLMDGKPDRAYGKFILHYLKDRQLFQHNELKNCVRMHKLIRLVALQKLQTDGKHKFLVLSNDESLDQSSMDKWNGKHWISCADNKNLDDISDSLNCSELSTLFLQGNLNFKKFSDSFFKKMGSLCVLDLMGTSIRSLPKSLIEAEKLAVLYLNECTNLSELPSEIRKLQHLEVLDLSGSGVTEKMQRLKYLKRFLVPSDAFREGDDTSLSDIPNVISGLTELQHMLIDTKWKRETYDWGIIDNVMRSVATLKCLTSLQFRFLYDEVVDVIKVVDKVTIIYVQKEEHLKYFVEKEDLDSSSFKVFIGCPISEDVKILNCEEFRGYVKYCNGNERSPTSFLKLLPKTDAVVIANHDNIDDLSQFNFSKASAILVENCNRIRFISNNCSTLSNLERLSLSDLQNLEILWDDSIHLSSLQNLKILQLTRCPKLIVIIIPAAAPGQELPEFAKLEELILVDMKRLTCICENKLLKCPALTTLTTSRCPALLHLPTPITPPKY